MASTKQSSFNIIRRPLITEKSAMLRAGDKTGVVFEVHPDANKIEIKKAVEEAFDVKVDSVRTINYRSTIRRIKNVAPREVFWKKAYVFLKPGQTLDVIEGL